MGGVSRGDQSFSIVRWNAMSYERGIRRDAFETVDRSVGSVTHLRAVH